MAKYFHSVRLIGNRCKGCVSCTKRCPTEAIRIRGGKAQITESRCIDCGECIRYCPNRAKTAVTDSLTDLAQYEYNVALPAPSLYAQFENYSIEQILGGLLSLGFDEVFEVAVGAEMVSAAIAKYIKGENIKKPLISSACPAVVRLIQVNFPELIDHLIPFEAPVEVAARMARIHCSNKVENEGNLGIWFITPCPAKMTAVRQPLGTEKSNVTGVIGISRIYGDLLKALHTPAARDLKAKAYRQASWRGVGWAVAGGETAEAEVQNTLVVHEIHSVNNVLEQVAIGKLTDIDYIEALACAGGCIGGPLTVENRFVAEHRMQQRIREMKGQEASQETNVFADLPEADLDISKRGNIEPQPVMRLDEDIVRAMYKVELMEETLGRLPGLDCGSCGSPNCKALAEDIVQGRASEMDCVFKLRERVHQLAKEMMNLAEKLPPSLDREQGSEEEGEDNEDAGSN